MSLVQVFNNGIHGSGGHVGSQGRHGSGAGGHGGNGGTGERGEDGTEAGNIRVYLAAPNDRISVDCKLSARSRANAHDRLVDLTLGDPNAEVQLSAIGGDGGHGGRGGDGGSGATGYHGHDATRHSSGTNGGPGGDGGDGGRGGDGGHSGNGADIDVHVKEIDMDIIMLLRQRIGETHAGSPGHGGSGGSGGAGGSGGSGGNSYHWTESRSYRDADGNTRTETTHHSNPGGFSGPSGSRGRDGSRGNNGHRGRDGRFMIHLARTHGGEEQYPSPYDLQVLFQWVVDIVGYQVIEPACHINLMVNHRNVGGMPTPSVQLIRAYVNNNFWVTCPVENRVPIQQWITPSTEVPIPQAIRAYITDITQPARGDPFLVTSLLEHRALVDRVNQDFSRVANAPTQFTIEFPTQNSLIRGGNVILFGEEAPLVFSIWNKAALGIGRDATPSRVLATTLHVLPLTQGSSKDGEPLHPGDIRLRTADGEIFDDFSVGLQSLIPLIAPSSKQFFAATLQFTNPDLKPYTRVCFESCLHLGHVQNMLVPRVIQIRSQEVQIAESYSRSEFADYLIIVNNQTQYDEVTAWRQVIRRIGGSHCVWNVHLYGDLSLDHIRKDGSTLLKDFRCRTIIYLNNYALKDEKLQQRPIEFARKRELFIAARDHGINTLVYGSADQFDLAAELVPANTHPKIVYFKKRSIFLQTMGKLLMPGEGDVQAIPAFADADVCGVLKRKKELWWCQLNLAGQTLCFYESARQHFPDGMIYLGVFNLKVNEEQTAFEIITPARTYCFEAPSEKEYQSKHGKYNGRKNYTVGIAKWVELLKDLEAQAGDRPPVSLPSSPDGSVASPPARTPSVYGSIGSADVPAETVAISGYLKKRGRKMKLLTRYFFAFDPTIKTLSYYPNAKSKQPKATVHVGRYTIEDLGQEKKEFLFKIATPSKVLVLAAPTQEDKENWIGQMKLLLPPTPSASIYREQSTIMRASLASPSPPNSPSASSSSISPPSSPSLSSLSSSLSSSMSLLNPGILSPTEREPTQHNSVPRVTIEGRYFFSTPTAKQLERKAKRLHKSLLERFPNQTNIIVYDFDSSKSKRGFRLFKLGTLDIHRSLDSTTPHFVTAPFVTDPEVHSAERISEPSTMYSLLKTLSFVRKLQLLDTELLERCPSGSEIVLQNKESLIATIMAAILSDIADEQKFFFKPTWRSGLNSAKIPQRLVTLDTLKKYIFACLSKHEEKPKSIPGTILIELVMHIDNITKSHTTIWDKILPFRRATQVSNASNAVCNQMMEMWFSGGDWASGLKDETEKIMDAKREAWTNVTVAAKNFGYNQEKFDRLAALAHYHNPPGLTLGGTTNSYATVPKVLSTHEFNGYTAPLRPDNVQEGKFLFKDDAARYASIDSYQRELGAPAGVEAASRTRVTMNVHPM